VAMLGSMDAPGHVMLTPIMVGLLFDDLFLGFSILGWYLLLGLFLLLIFVDDSGGIDRQVVEVAAQSLGGHDRVNSVSLMMIL